MKKEKCDSRVKTRKDWLEQKRENFQRFVGRANRRMKRQQPDSIRSIYEVLNPFQNLKIWTFYLRVPSPNFLVYHGGTWRLSNCHIQRLGKINLLRCLIFKEFIFLEKKWPWKRATLLLNQIVKINLLSQIIRFPS